MTNFINHSYMIKEDSKPDLPRAFDLCVRVWRMHCHRKFSSKGTLEALAGNKAVLIVEKDKLVN